MNNNIFSALMYRRNANVVREFVLWCILCFDILLFLISAVVPGSRITWILLMFFTMGLAVMMAFRLTGIALLYSIGVFHLMTVTIHYICYRTGGDHVADLLLFVLLILLALAALICSFVHHFTRFNLDKVVMGLVLGDSVFIMILQIMLYVQRRSDYGYFEDFSVYDRPFRWYWMGGISFWILLAVIDLYYIFFALGLIDRGWNKIIEKIGNSGNLGNQGNYGYYGGYGGSAAIQGVRGECVGQMIYLKNREIIIGSDRSAGAVLVLHNAHVSRWHCAVRYHPGRNGNGFYEVFDRSMNGVYLNTGGRLSQNVWNRLPRGSVICIGGMEEQMRLL